MADPAPAPPETAPGPARPGLSVAQLNAVDLLAVGKTDAEAAAAAGVHRVTVTRWRLYSPAFRAALADRRQAIWGAAGDRLRALLPKAIDTLEVALKASDDWAQVAVAVVKLAGPLPPPSADPTDPDEIVRRAVDRERAAAADRAADLPAYDDHVARVREQLERLAGAGDPEPNGGSQERRSSDQGVRKSAQFNSSPSIM